MEVSGVLPGQPTVPEYRITVDSSQATRFTHATALGDVVQHRDHRGRLQLGAKQWGPLPLRKACLAGAAVEQAHRMLLPVVHTDTQVTSTALAMGPAVSIMTAKPREIVHYLPSTCTIQPGSRLFSVAKWSVPTINCRVRQPVSPPGFVPLGP